MPVPIDDHFLLRYRELLDAEDTAFDELEHAYEDGNRPHFEEEMDVWHEALTRKAAFLDNAGLSFTHPVS